MQKIVIKGSNGVGYFAIEVALGKRSPKLFILDPKTITVGLGMVKVSGHLNQDESQKVLFTLTKTGDDDHWSGIYETMGENYFKSKEFILTTRGHTFKPTASLYYVTEEKETTRFFIVFLGSLIVRSKYVATKISARFCRTSGAHQVPVPATKQKIDQNLLLKNEKGQWSFSRLVFP